MQRPTSFSEAEYGDIHDRIFDVLRAHPEGISVNDLRAELGIDATEQQHLDRRVRDLDDYYIITRQRVGRRTLYTLDSLRPVPRIRDKINKTTRYRILQRDGHRCQSCGRTAIADGVRLHVDHKIPRSWGGSSDDENLWVLCSECNEGKKNFFASITDARIQQALTHDSIHIRLGELLKAFEGEWVPKANLAVIAWTHDDWEKRLRELREIGWDYKTRRQHHGKRVLTEFTITQSAPWPEDPARAIREAERRKRTKR